MKKLIISSLMVLFIAGCAAGLTKPQKQEYQAYKAKGLLVEEDNPGTAAALGILPGGGSFYTGNIGLGVVNLLFWPVSILWDPISGVNGAESNNYYATLASVNKQKQRELDDLTAEFELGAIQQKDYLVKKREVEKKYSPNY